MRTLGPTLLEGSYPFESNSTALCPSQPGIHSASTRGDRLGFPLGGHRTAATLAKLEPRHPLAGGIPPATNPPTLWVFERGLHPRRPPPTSQPVDIRM